MESLGPTPDVEPGLDATATFSLPGLDPINEHDEINVTGMYPFMVDIAFVEVDPDTGRINLDSYLSVHDSGTVLNHDVVTGQRRGAIAHGIGGALYEHLDHLPDGRPAARTLHDYHCLTASDMPPLFLDDVQTPSPLTPLGAKGCGDGAATPAPVAIANAVADALRPLGARITELPLSAESVWRLRTCGRDICSRRGEEARCR